MRIGIFTDTYRPSINGIVFVVESTKKHLESLGHEVYVFCPGRSIRPSRRVDILEDDNHIIRFSSVKGAFYDDYDTSLFLPPRVLRRIRELDLDLIHFVTPGQVGIMGVYAAYKTNTPLVAQHCTDLRQYVDHYRDTTLLPGLLALISIIPFTLKVTRGDVRDILKMYRPRRDSVEWNRDIVETMITLVYKKCDAVIALSRKSKAQLESWQKDEDSKYEVTLLPNGVNQIKPPTEKELADFRSEWDIDVADEVFGFVGRLGSEKNLAMLIPALEKVRKTRPRARLLFVGDFEFREELERLAGESSAASRITFTGSLPRETLGRVYSSMDVFVFPSQTDTQGWVLHEAAHAGLPLVVIDREVSEVVIDGKNGYYADDDADSVAEKITKLLADQRLREEFGAESKKLANKFTERRQIAKLVKLYEQTIISHGSRQKPENIDF